MYNSQYYTCEQIDQRLLQGYLDDYNTQTGQSLTKEQFLTKLGDILANWQGIDNEPTPNSNNFAKSGGIYSSQNDVKGEVLELNRMNVYIGRWSSSAAQIVNNGKHVVIPIKRGYGVYIKANAEVNTTVLVLSDFDFSHSFPYSPSFATGESARVLTPDHSDTIISPSDAKYLYIQVVNNSNEDCSPQRLIINELDYSKSLRELVLVNKQNVEALQTAHNILNNYVKDILGSNDSDRGNELTLVVGRIKTDGSIDENVSYKRSLPFAAKKGDVIYVYTNKSTSSGYAPVSKATGSGSIEDPYVYSPLLTFDTNWYSYAYVVEEDCNIAICFRGDDEYSVHLFDSYVFEDIIRKHNKLKNIVEAYITLNNQAVLSLQTAHNTLDSYVKSILGSNEADKGSDIVLVNGRIKVDGTVTDDVDYRRSTPFAVKKGDIIYVHTIATTSSGYAPVSKVTGSGTEEDPYVYTPLLTFATSWASYGYVVEEDGNIAICFRPVEYSVHFFSSYVFEDIIRKISNLKEYIDVYKSKGYVFRGIATPNMSAPSVLGRPYFYLACEAGTYTNLGGVNCEDGINIIVTVDGVSWSRIRFVGFESGRSDVPQLAKLRTVNEINYKLGSAETVDLLSEVIWTNGYTINSAGTIVETSSRRYSNDISVKKGDVLIIVSNGGNISRYVPPYMIKRVEDGVTTFLNDFVWENASSTWAHYYHIFEEDCTIVINTFEERHGYTYLYRGSVISQLYNNDVNNADLQFNLYGLKKLPIVAKGIGSNNKWNTNPSIYIPVTVNAKLEIDCGTQQLNYCFLRSLKTIDVNTPDFVYPEVGRTNFIGKATLVVPAEAKYLFILNSQLSRIISFKVDGVSYLGNGVNVIADNINDLADNINDLAEDINDLDTNEHEVKMLNIVDPSTINHTDQEPQLVLLHFSDIHNDITRFKRVLDYYRKNARYINDVLMSGDCAGSWYDDLNRNILSLEDFDKVLMEIGNHDTYAPYGDNPPEGDAPTMQELYETFLGQIANWGVVQPEGAGENDYYPCYYYKDYPACKMRLVVLDCMHWDMTQSDWFAGVLAETLDNTKDCYGYHVIGSQHYLSHDGLNNLTLFDTPFNSLDDYKLEAQSTIVGSVTVVDTFINNGGVFVCWLGGHIHSDFCGLLTNHNNQIFINVGSASRITPAQDCARIEATQTQDLFNVIGFDFFSKTIKVMRVGATYDRYLRHRDTMCIKYGDNPSLVYTS